MADLRSLSILFPQTILHASTASTSPRIWSLLLQESIKPDPVKPLEPVQHDQASLAPAMRGSKAWVQLAPSSFLFLVVRPGAPSSVLAPSSDVRSP